MSLIVFEDTINGDIYSREFEHPAGKVVAASVWQNGYLILGASVVEVSETKTCVVVQNNFGAQVRLLIDEKNETVAIPASDTPPPRRQRPAHRRRSNGKD